MTKTIKIEDTTAKKLYKTASKELKTILEENFGVSFFSDKIIDRIQNFDDVLEELGKTLEEVVPYKNPKTKAQKFLNALAKIQCITEVYNEGVESDWNNNSQYKYYPWFEKKAPGGGWVFDSCTCFSYAYLGFGCYFTKEENCKDAAKKFIDIYKDYLPE